MFRPRLIPCLLLKNLGLVKTIKFQESRYIGDPMNAVKIFNDLEADELIFLDIEASKESRILPIEFVKKVGEEAFMPFAVGGGIKTMEDIRKILKNGAEKVVINTQAIQNPDFIRNAADTFGSQSIIISIDVKKYTNNKYHVFTNSGTKNTFRDPISVAKQMEELGTGEIVIHSIDNDGMMSGFDLNLIKSISQAVKIPVIALGGAGKLDHLAQAITKGKASAVAAGSIFIYSGKERGILINYPDREETKVLFND